MDEPLIVSSTQEVMLLNSCFRSKEHMESAKRTYEILNSELHDELPALHDSRLLFTVTNMQTLFAAEEVFHTETAKVANCAAEMQFKWLMFRSNFRCTANWRRS